MLDTGEGRLEQFAGNLLIRGSEVTDSGRYRCTASNTLGSAEVIVNLVVTGEDTNTISRHLGIKGSCLPLYQVENATF